MSYTALLVRRGCWDLPPVEQRALHTAHGEMGLASTNALGSQHQVAPACQLKCLQSIFMVLSVSLLLPKVENRMLSGKESVLKRKLHQLLYLQTTPRS